MSEATKVMACRCEDVSVQDLADAVERGHRDLESVKRYTGFGTGWCQGKHCLAACARAIVELGGAAPRLPITPRPPFRPVALADLAGEGALAGEASSGGRAPSSSDGETRRR